MHDRVIEKFIHIAKFTYRAPSHSNEIIKEKCLLKCCSIVLFLSRFVFEMVAFLYIQIKYLKNDRNWSIFLTNVN